MSDAGQDGLASPRQPGSKCLRVGCALLPKKVSRYLTPTMMATAAANNIELVLIDYTQPLAPQGPFSAIIHKLRPNQEWEALLAEYVRDHPWVRVIDRLDRIRTLQNRATMLSPLKGTGIVIQRPVFDADGSPLPSPAKRPRCAQVLAPLQVELAEGTTAAEAAARLAAAGLSPPLLCKPLWTDGREGSHGLAVLHDLEALGALLDGEVSSEFRPPLVVQQYVEHGGVLFKVYVLGTQTVVTPRPSLSETHLEGEEGVQQLPRISCVSHYVKQQAAAAAAAAGSSGGGAPGTSLGMEAAGASGSSGGMCTPVRPGQPSQQQEQQQDAGVSPSAAAPTSAGAGFTTPLGANLTHSSPEDGSITASPCPSLPWSPPPSPASQPPPEWVTTALSRSLRKRLGMQLFNFDLICPEAQEDADKALYYVCDINYFPGVDKIPGFEQRFVDFLRAACEKDLTRGSSICSNSGGSSGPAGLWAQTGSGSGGVGGGMGPPGPVAAARAAGAAAAAGGGGAPASASGRVCEGADGSQTTGSAAAAAAAASLVAKAALTGSAGSPGAAAGDGSSSSTQERGMGPGLQANSAQQPPQQQQQQQRGSPLCSRQGSFSKQQQAAAAGPRPDKSSSSGSLRAVAAAVGGHVMGSSPVQQQQHPALQMAECS